MCHVLICRVSELLIQSRFPVHFTIGFFGVFSKNITVRFDLDIFHHMVIPRRFRSEQTIWYLVPHALPTAGKRNQTRQTLSSVTQLLFRILEYYWLCHSHTLLSFMPFLFCHNVWQFVYALVVIIPHMPFFFHTPIILVFTF